MAYKVTREKALTFLFETLTAKDWQKLEKGSNFAESEKTIRLRKELNDSLLEDYRSNSTGKFAVECMRKAINVYCKVHNDFYAPIAISKAISKDGINSVVDTVDRFARLFIDSVNGSISKVTTKTVYTFKVSDAKKLYSICGDVTKVAEYFGVPANNIVSALTSKGVKVTVEDSTTEDSTTEDSTK